MSEYDRPLARLPGLFVRFEVAEFGQAFRLDVVLALAGPVEHPSAACHLQQVVSPRSAATDETEDLVREQAEFVS